MDYFLFRQGVQYGPYNIQQIRTFLSEGRVLPTDLCRTAATPQWQPLQVLWQHAPAALPTTRGNILSWPFHQQSWFESLWMTLLWWFPVPLFPLGACLCLGWSVDAARRWSGKASDLLPRPEAFGRMFVDGLTVAAFFCLYIAIPVTIGWIATSLGALSFVVPLLHWSWDYLHNRATVPIADMLGSILVNYLIHRALVLLYLVLAWPLFTAAGIRFVLTRKTASFFELPSCFDILFHNFGAILKFLILSALVSVAVAVADAIAAPTGIGLPLAIPIGAAGVWSITYLFANLAAKVQPAVRTGGAGGPF